MMVAPLSQQHSRFWLLLVVTVAAYLVCIITLFEMKGFVIPLVSFIVLFILLYFLAIDVTRYPKKPLLLLFLVLILVEIAIFAIGKTRHLYLEVLLFNLTILVLFYQLSFHLTTRIRFSSFAYFTEGGYTIAVLITLFVSVLMIGKYAQIPFTCEDINTFLPKVLSFSHPKIPAIDPTHLPTELSEIEQSFLRMKNYIMKETLDLQESMNKNNCEFVMTQLKKTQINQGFQIAVVVLLYFLLIGFCKIILWIINFFAFFIFVLLKPFNIYQYEKKKAEKEWLR